MPYPPAIYKSVSLDIIGPGYTEDEGDPDTGKPFIRLSFPQGPVVHITTNLAEMIGGAGMGAAVRFKDLS